MVQIKYFAGFNKEGRGMVESILCDWILEKSEKKELVMYCYRNDCHDPVAIIKSKNSVLIESVFEGSEE